MVKIREQDVTNTLAYYFIKSITTIRSYKVQSLEINYYIMFKIR
jgi:hypothetical protein